MTYDFANYKDDSLTRPRDKAWSNWFTATKVGDKASGYIRDVFYRKSEGVYRESRGITLETPKGELVNVAIKRIPFILAKTDNLRLGDPLTVVLEEEKKPKEKGLSPTKIYGYYGKNLEENVGNKTVYELDKEDKEKLSEAPTVSEDEDDDFKVEPVSE